MTKQTIKKFEQKFLHHCQEKKFFSKNDRVLLAVSGGMDSMLLSHLLGIFKQELHVDIGVAHVNHNLRKSASDRDEIFVKNFALAHHYPFYRKKVDVHSKAKLSKTSLEEAARNLRYVFLEKVARQYGYNKICTAHHGSDQAETVLMRIIKGSGLSGLSGIREKRGLFIRPLLIFSKEEIRTYVHTKNIEYVDDHSNFDTVFLRNRIRHELMPKLKNKFDPQIEKHLIQLSFIADEIQTYFKHHAKAQFSRVCRVFDDKIVLEIKSFNRYLRAQRHVVIEYLFEEYFGVKLFFADYQRLFDLIEKKQSGKRIIFDSVVCSKTSTQIIFESGNRMKNSEFCFDIDADRSYHWKKPELAFKSLTANYSPKLKKEFGRSPDVEYVDIEKITGPLRLRNWKPGDQFMPLGMKNLKKISDFFIDNKIPLHEKKKIPVLCEQVGGKENIIWLCGLRIDDRYKIENSTHHTLKLECKRHEKDHSDGTASL